MKSRVSCEYRNVCNGNQCKNCELKNTPYDKYIAYQLKINLRKSKEEEQNRIDLANEIMQNKSINN